MFQIGARFWMGQRSPSRADAENGIETGLVVARAVIAVVDVADVFEATSQLQIFGGLPTGIQHRHDIAGRAADGDALGVKSIRCGESVGFRGAEHARFQPELARWMSPAQGGGCGERQGAAEGIVDGRAADEGLRLGFAALPGGEAREQPAVIDLPCGFEFDAVNVAIASIRGLCNRFARGDGDIGDDVLNVRVEKRCLKARRFTTVASADFIGQKVLWVDIHRAARFHARAAGGGAGEVGEVRGAEGLRDAAEERPLVGELLDGTDRADDIIPCAFGAEVCLGRTVKAFADARLRACVAEARLDAQSVCGVPVVLRVSAEQLIA